MSYSIRCAEAPIGNILVNARSSSDWSVNVSESTGEVSLSYVGPNTEARTGSFTFGFVDVDKTPDAVTTSVACYGGPSIAARNELKSLIQNSK